MLKCPYQIGPISKTKIDYFIDRKGVLERICDVLDLAVSGSQYQNVAVYGKRQIGKTSLLNKINNVAHSKNLLVIDFPISGSIKTSAFFGELHDAVIREGRKEGLFKKWYEGLFLDKLKLDKFSLDIPFVNFEISLQGKKVLSDYVSTTSLIDAFENLSNESDRPILVLIDEAQWLSDNKELLQNLRNIFQRVEGFVFIFFGTEDMLDALSAVFEAMERFFLRIHLGPYSTVKDAREAIELPILLLRNELSKSDLERYPAKFSESSIDDIIDISQNYPYHINFFCYYAFLISLKRGLPEVEFTKDIIDEIMSQKTKITHNILAAESKYNELSEGQKKILKGVAILKEASASDLAISITDDNNGPDFRNTVSNISVQLKRLEDKGIVQALKVTDRRKPYSITDVYLRLYIKYIG